MKRLILTTLTAATFVGAANGQVTNTHTVTPVTVSSPQVATNKAAVPTNAPATNDYSKIFKTDKEKFSYAIGMTWAMGIKSRMKGEDIDFDSATLTTAFREVLDGQPTVITEAQQREIMTDLGKQLSVKRDEKRRKQVEEDRIKGEKNLTEGGSFLARNKGLTNVVSLPSGLQYKILTTGNGPIPGPNDEVTVNYRGTLIDGTEFGSSAKDGKPLVTPVQGGLIKGWSEALQLMKAGSKWQIYVPSSLAYGSRAYGNLISPNSTLIFDVELLSVKAAPTAATPPPQPAPSAAVTPPPPAPVAVAPVPTPVVAPQPSAPPPTPLTSDIIKVPSAEEMKKGAKIETIKAEDLEKEKAKANQ